MFDPCIWKEDDGYYAPSGTSIDGFILFSRQFVGSRVYPTREDSRGISFFSRGGVAKVLSMDVWQMRSIWPELKHQEGK